MELRAEGVAQRLLCADPLVRVELQHLLEQVKCLRGGGREHGLQARMGGRTHGLQHCGCA
jgi:hypothetical protein